MILAPRSPGATVYVGPETVVSVVPLTHSSVTFTPGPQVGAVAVRVLPTVGVPAIVGVTGERAPDATVFVGADDRLVGL